MGVKVYVVKMTLKVAINLSQTECRIYKARIVDFLTLYLVVFRNLLRNKRLPFLFIELLEKEYSSVELRILEF